MRALHRFQVQPTVPEPLAALVTLAKNLHWTWDPATRALFARLDPERWRRTGHDPVALLEQIPPTRWAELSADPELVAAVAARADDLRHALGDDRWFQHRRGSPLRQVAYFSPEFGITETLAQYSGGLGVLAGDHLKAASDLGLPLVAVGLLYREGYFHQALDADGYQGERFPRMNPESTALHATGLQVDVDLAGERVVARVWRADVGRVALYLLDTDVEPNSPEARRVTDRLYGGDVEHRLRQEIVLGIGGVRALRALGLAPQVFHTNEGHAGFLALERIREHVDAGLTFAEAIEAVRAGGLFTTHTPVPAGIDRYSRELMTRYFTTFATQMGATLDDLMALGHNPGEPDGPKFNMAVMGLGLSARSNAVAALHGQVSRRMFHHLWPGATEAEVPITSVTNGVHAKTWVSAAIDELLTRSVHPVWDGAGSAAWRGVTDLDDGELWRARRRGRASLVRFVRRRVHGDVLDPDVLTVGFARRFATYKRATLLLSQPDRLKRLLLDADRPVQFVFAGKAHPADSPGKEMIRQIERFARELDVSHRFVFVADYDMGVARRLYQGCDVWLNTPRRPLEACGTSGMKAALNGALNVSVLDGWWDECADGTNGWIVESADDDPDPARRDQREALNLFNVLEGQVVPLFYEGSPPRGWIARMKHAWTTLGPFVTAARMVQEYATRLYEPAAAGADAFGAEGYALAREVAAWKARVTAAWPRVHIDDVQAEDGKMAATVHLAGLDAHEVACEIAHGPVDPDGEFVAQSFEALDAVDRFDGTVRFAGSFAPTAAGAYGATLRVRPTHPALVNPVETGLITWAS